MADKIIPQCTFGIPEPEPALIHWNQLAQYCNKHNKDFYTEVASRAFNVPYDKVNVVQRAEAKRYMLHVMYSRGKIPEPPKEIN